MTSQEAMNHAIDVLRDSQDYKMGRAMTVEAVEFLEEALANQEQGEPAAKYIGEGNEGSLVQLYDDVKKGTDFYTTPQQRTWVGLTDDEIYQVMQDRTWMHTEGLCRAIEAKLRSKNNG
jgi:hypothetical protein